jgi:hypothetical protein
MHCSHKCGTRIDNKTSRIGLAADPALGSLEVGSRHVHLAGCTYHPTGVWVAQRASHWPGRAQEGGLAAQFLLRDRDSKLTAALDER